MWKAIKRRLRYGDWEATFNRAAFVAKQLGQQDSGLLRREYVFGDDVLSITYSEKRHVSEVDGRTVEITLDGDTNVFDATVGQWFVKTELRTYRFGDWCDHLLHLQQEARAKANAEYQDNFAPLGKEMD